MTRRTAEIIAVIAGLASLAVVAGCGPRADRNGEPGPFDLVDVADCADLERAVRAAAKNKMNEEVDAVERGMLEHSCPCGGCGSILVNSTDTGTARVSTTNNQVPGVDEADFVKNDGRYIYVLSSRALRILQAWPAADARELARVDLEGTPRKLFVHGDRLLVYVSLAPPASTGSGPGTCSGGACGTPMFSECTYGYSCAFGGDGNPTKMLLFDIGDRRAPRLVRELALSGSYVNARRVGSAVHTVVSSPGARFPGVMRWPEQSMIRSFFSRSRA